MAAVDVLLPPDLSEKLKELSENQSEWTKVSYSEKLALLEELDRVASTLPMEEWHQLGEWTASTMMGIPPHTAEGQCQKTTEAAFPLIMVKEALGRLTEAYKMACNNSSSNAKIYADKLQPKTSAVNGQTVMNVFPLLTKDKFGPNAELTVQWWLDPITTEKPRPFSLEKFSDNKKEGVLVVLEAGNQNFLTLVDTLEALFVRQRVVLVKHHPLRAGLDPLMQKLFQPLYDAGYLASVLDLGKREANSALVYNPLVNGVHMTGGKATHDAIVWGSTKAEQERNKKSNTPKLTNAEMTSELGCITPWIITPGTYTPQELKHHAEMVVMGVHSGASANCCAAKMLVMDQDWDQREEFVTLLKTAWGQLELPVAYYPGSKERWMAYQEAYPAASLWEGRESGDRQLSPSLMNAARGETKATVLPLLCVDVKANISTEEGRTAAQNEYACQKEPFCPVLTFATLPSQDFLMSASTFCNDYVYGSLSCSLSFPSSKDQDPAVEAAIADLKYGSVAVNLWSGFTYSFGWGGHPEQESLDNVQSGTGRINNYLFIPNVQKSVVRAPSLWTACPKVNPDYEQGKREMGAVAAFVRAPGLGTFVSLLAATTSVPPAVKYGAMAAAVGVISIIVRSNTMA